MPVLEAQAAGCPVIAWQADGPDDMLNGGAIHEIAGSNGALYIPKRKGALSLALQGLMKVSDKRTNLVANGQVRAREFVGWDATADRWIQVLKRIEACNVFSLEQPCAIR